MFMHVTEMRIDVSNACMHVFFLTMRMHFEWRSGISKSIVLPFGGDGG